MSAIMHESLSFIIGLAAVISVLLLATRWIKRGPYPPGPKGYPLIGNLFDMPDEKEWLTFAAWGKRYGWVHST